MPTFKRYMDNGAEPDEIYDDHYHMQNDGSVTGPPVRTKTDDGRKSHYHKQSDGHDTTEARPINNKFVYDDNIKGSVTSLPKSGYHLHMQNDGKHTSVNVLPEREEDGESISISEKITLAINEVEISRQYKDAATKYNTKLIVTVDQKELDKLSTLQLADWDEELLRPKAGGKGYGNLGEYSKGNIRTFVYGVDHHTKVSQQSAYKKMKALTSSVKFDLD